MAYVKHHVNEYSAVVKLVQVYSGIHVKVSTQQDHLHWFECRRASLAAFVSIVSVHGCHSTCDRLISCKLQFVMTMT